MVSPILPASTGTGPDSRDKLRRAIHRAAHLLPAQGPIGVFVHHNTLHAFEALPFEEAVVQAAGRFGTEPYLSEEAYRHALARGRIREEDLDAVLAPEPDAAILSGGHLTRRQLRRLMLSPGPRPMDARGIEWLLDDGGWTRQFRPGLGEEAATALAGDRPANLWKVCLERTRSLAPPPGAEALGPDRSEVHGIIHPVLIRFCAVFLDQGAAYWPMPEREQGFWRATLTLLGQPLSIHPRGLEGLGGLVREVARRGLTSGDAVLFCLEALAVDAREQESFLTSELIALPGWAGMFHCLEADPSLAPHVQVPFSLTDFLAVRLLLHLQADRNGIGTSRGDPPAEPEGLRRGQILCEAATVFEIAQLGGIGSAAWASVPDDAFSLLLAEIRAFPALERRRLFHLAYERRHERQILIPLARHLRLPAPNPTGPALAVQVFFCIDEREESIRRHLEEVDPGIETFGAAGFFGIAVDYTGLDDAMGSALCPIVIKPRNEVLERPVGSHHQLDRRRQFLRRLRAKVLRNSSISSRSLVRGWISTVTLGFFSLFPLALRVLSPLAHARLMSWLNKAFLPQPRTELTFERQDEVGREVTGGLLRGFSLAEKVECVASVLGPAGLHEGLAHLVVILGHGSTSLNNPFESAYDCGACGGRRGGPNARLFAAMANLPRVRAGLRDRGIEIPGDTWFLGGCHDTCKDEFEFYDLDALPDHHRADLDRLRTSLDEARMRNAHERSRRFETARPRPRPGPRGALRHVEERSEHLGEPRPEYGHCTNAVCIVGRRTTTRGLFLDRRSFLASYDPSRDPAGESLARVLGAVIPVCAGINLEYYFSTVDNEGYGCGTKLPHNITGLIGVMNGYQGDLRTGLPLQTVEIHEPVRILFVVEAAPERVLAVIRANRQLDTFLCNRWIRLASLNPGDGEIAVYRDGAFAPFTGDEEALPVAPSSESWYRGQRDHLPVARIESRRPSAA